MEQSDLYRSDKIPLKYFEEVEKNELKKRLTLFILDLLVNDFQRLTLLLYRHDVAEQKASLAMREPTNEQKASHLAELVIERELQKAATRKAYRQYKENRKNKRIE